MLNRVAKTVTQRVNAFSLATSSRGIHQTVNMSFASPESDFVASQSFRSIDANNDGMITREEMLAGASKFGLNQVDASHLFDLLDTDKNGTLNEAEFSRASWKLAVSKNISLTSPESDFASSFQRIDANNDGVITREEMLAGASKFGLNQADASRLFDLLDTNKNGTLDEAEFSHASWKLAISKKMSFASPESDFVAPQEKDGYNPSKVMEMLLFPSELSFASAESDFSATPIDMAAASLREEWNTGLSFSSPESDFSAPTAEDIEMSANYTLSYNLSFASPESDFSAPTSEEIQQSRGHVPILSFASPESDFTACSQAEFEAMAESSYKPGLSWSAPESDFVSANTEVAIHAQEKQETSLALAVAPSTEARVITRKDRPFEIFHVNEAWTRLCGFGLDECRGKTLQILQGENTDQRKVKELVESITNHQAVETVLRNYNKQGREFTNHLRINRVVDENGDVTHLLGTLREVANHEERRQINHAI